MLLNYLRVICTLSVLCLFTLFPKKGLGQREKVVKDRILSVVAITPGQIILTPIDISCEGFLDRSSWIDEMDTFIFRRQIQIQQIEGYLKSAKYADDYKYGIDVRGKVFINYESGKTDVLCFAYTPIFLFNGRPMISQDKSLIMKLDSINALR